MLPLIPSVKKLEIRDGLLSTHAVRYPQNGIDSRLLTALKKLPYDETGAEVKLRISGEVGEGYSLSVNRTDICIEAQGPAGAFYAIQTLRQLFKNEQIPCLSIEDAPDFRYRGFYHDVTRGKVPTLETVKHLIDQMAYYKLNSLQLYVEHTFEFEEYKALHAATGYLTKEELRQIGAYCKENFIDFIPSLSTFGHLFELLEQPQYRHLRVLSDYQAAPSFWLDRMKHHTIDPENPQSIALVESLIDQYMECFDSRWFNICCDETFDLKRYDEMGLDSGALYVEFVKKIITHVQKRGKKVMMWGDILLKHPHVISQLPDDICFLNWDYGAQPREENIRLLAQTGKMQIVCPGTTTWSRLCERVGVEESNICRMAEYGYRHGAAGVLNTNWGDWGNPCSIELAMYGLVLGAEKSWSVCTEPDEKFYARVDASLYESQNGVAYLKELSCLHELVSWRKFAANYFTYRYHTGEEHLEDVLAPVEDIQKAYMAFANKLSRESWKQDEYRQEMLLAAEGLCLMAELSCKLAGKACCRITDTGAWLEKFSEKWLQKNKRSELDRIAEVFTYYESV